MSDWQKVITAKIITVFLPVPHAFRLVVMPKVTGFALCSDLMDLLTHPLLNSALPTNKPTDLVLKKNTHVFVKYFEK